MSIRGLKRSRQIPPTHPFTGKKTWVPRMATGVSRALAAVLRSIGIDAEAIPPPDAETLELGGRHTSGEECYPLRLTVGDFLKILQKPGVDPAKLAFFMATGQGPCRFGQYAPYVKSMLASLGYPGVTILAPACETGYSDFGEASSLYTRGAWRAIVCSDILFKLLLKTRPYEIAAGSSDLVYEESLCELCRTLEVPYASNKEQMSALQECMLRIRDCFRAVEIKQDPDRPLIGVVGEIFCRLNTFSNDDLVRRLEEFGAEVRLNDVSEWIWYVNDDEFRTLRLRGRHFSLRALSAHVRNHFQHKDERDIAALFNEDFHGYEEPSEMAEVLGYAEPYLPPLGANGEMIVNIGKAVYFSKKGADGVIDISPFTCMNGIICEAIYPRVSRDNGGIPIRNFYFDGTQFDLERDVGIFLELARNYHGRKTCRRPSEAACFAAVEGALCGSLAPFPTHKRVITEGHPTKVGKYHEGARR
jgi:predicted nucleotide-binding protein (sugar kinase/HSP70/actin superfamily)